MTPEPRHEGRPTAAVVTVGDELLYGHTTDTNGAWLGENLSDLGFEVARRTVVGDDPVEIQESLALALDGADVVVVTGGLGPTPDDLTRPVVADLMGRKLILSTDLRARLERRFKDRGYDRIPDGAEAMAEIPEGAAVLPNPIGVAPGLVFDSDRRNLCVLLPGVPREMKAIFSQEVRPLLSRIFEGRLRPVRHRMIPTFGVPESVLQEELASVLPEEMKGVSLAFLPDEVSVRLRLSARDEGGKPPAETRLDSVEAAIQPVLAPYRFQARTGDLAEAVGGALGRAGLTLAVAESCTGGLVSKRITDIPGSSSFFLGGIVAYANEVKSRFLEVAEEEMISGGVVSEAVAESMALGVARAFGAGVGVGVTGIAGPGGGSMEKPVGTVCYSVSIGGEAEVRTEVFPGDRPAIRARAAHAVLGLLLRTLKGRGE